VVRVQVGIDAAVAAHLPSLELPADFLDLTSRWLATTAGR
jgi:hypothetical protein